MQSPGGPLPSYRQPRHLERRGRPTNFGKRRKEGARGLRQNDRGEYYQYRVPRYYCDDSLAAGMRESKRSTAAGPLA